MDKKYKAGEPEINRVRLFLSKSNLLSKNKAPQYKTVELHFI